MYSKKFIPILMMIPVLLGINSSYAQIENVIVETYYVTDINDTTDTLGGDIALGATTYRIYVDLKEGSLLRKIYGNQYHPIYFRTTTKFFNHQTEGKSFAKDFNKNRFKESTVALDSWITIGQISNSSATLHGILKTQDNNGSFVGGINNDSGLLINNTAAMGIALTQADGIINFNAPLANWASYGIVDPVSGNDSTIFGSLVSGNEFYSNNAGVQCAGITGVNINDNKVLIAQLTTDGALSFRINAEVEIPQSNGSTLIVKYVADKDTLFADEKLSPFLSYPFLCGCTDANYVEYSEIYACSNPDACQTKIVLGCMDSTACNFDPKANFNVPGLCCYPGYCNDRNIAVVCPEFAAGQFYFYLYPNPASSPIHVTFWLVQPADVYYSITSIFGAEISVEKKLGNYTGKNEVSIDISDLENGVYYLKLRAGNIEQRKIMIKN
jgi:hypothetical protein